MKTDAKEDRLLTRDEALYVECRLREKATGEARARREQIERRTRDTAAAGGALANIFGAELRSRFGRAELRAFENGIVKGYLVTNRRHDWLLDWRWMAWCGAGNHPYVVVVVRGRVAEVRYDLGFTDCGRLTAEAWKEIARLCRCAGAKELFVGTVAGHARVPKAEAEPLAQAVLELAVASDYLAPFVEQARRATEVQPPPRAGASPLNV